MRRSLRLLSAVLVLVACGGRRPEDSTPIRLIDHLADAEVESPLLDAPALEALLSDPKWLGSELWSTDFSTRERMVQGGCQFPESGGIECLADLEDFGLRVDVRGAAYTPTAVVLELQTESPDCIQVELQDAAERLVFPLPRGATSWRRVPIVWPGRPEAAEITLRLSRHRLAEPCRLALRSVASYALEPDRDLRLALLDHRRRSSALGEYARSAGFGAFLPLSDAETVRPPFDDSFATREVLLAPAPTRFCFRLRIPPRARLGFSYALSRESELGDQAGFEIRATTDDGGDRLLWSDELVLGEDNWHWHEAAVSLEEYGGQSIDLTLLTRAASGGGLALWGTPTVETPRRNGDPPNVILIAVDTLRADRMSAYGYSERTTPRLDAFAEDGVLFRYATSQSNWTLPSFASIFTGKIVARHRLATWTHRLSPSAVTLPGLFRAHGWRTHAVLYKPALYQRLDRGFETSFNVPRQNHRADQNLDKALDWVGRHHDERFFLFLHFDDPHQPFTQPEEFLQESSLADLAGFGLEMPVNLRKEAASCAGCSIEGVATDALKSLARRMYDEEIRYVDDRIGRFLDELHRLGVYDDTVIGFVSDHGETLWSHYELFGHGGANQHDELIRVPLIVKPAAGHGLARGGVVSTRVRAFDLMPTLLELAGIAIPADLDARSLVGLLRPPTDAPVERDREAFSQSSASAAFQSGRWKYVMPVGRGEFPDNKEEPRLAAEELYDLQADPAELRDLAAEEPAMLRAMREAAIEYVIGAVGGDFLLVAGDTAAPGQVLDISCDAGCGWDPLLQFGLARAETEALDVSTFTGAGLGEGVLLLARLQAGPEGTLMVRSDRAGSERSQVAARRVTFERGVIGRLLPGEGLRAWVLSAADRGAEGVEAAVMDPRQEEALRDLGYLQ